MCRISKLGGDCSQEESRKEVGVAEAELCCLDWAGRGLRESRSVAEVRPGLCGLEPGGFTGL